MSVVEAREQDCEISQDNQDIFQHDTDVLQSNALEDIESNHEEKQSFMSMDPKELGRRGEDAAARLLQEKGYDILERNYTCMAGEADIVAMDDEYLIFIEVKTRSGIEKGLPEEAVSSAKRARYERIAAYYISEHDCPRSRIRFDVIGILVVQERRAIARHIINAFG